MKYFRYFPKLDYDLDDNKQFRQAVDLFRISKVVSSVEDDITFYRYYTIQDGERPDHVSQSLYNTVDYYWTFFLVNTNLKNYYTDWPRSRQKFDEYLEETYKTEYIGIDTYDFFDKFEAGETVQGLISGARATIVSKNTSMGWIEIKDRVGTFQSNEIVRGLTSLDFITISGVGSFKDAAHHYEDGDGNWVPRSEPSAAIVTYADYDFQLNEDKREIRVIRPEFVDQVVSQFRESLNG